VISQPDFLRRETRAPVQNICGFYGGGSSVTRNKAKYAAAMADNAFVRNTILIERVLRKYFILDPSSIAWQLELIARLTPSTLETLSGETEVVLWSWDVPKTSWVEVLTAVAHIVGEWESGRFVKKGYTQETTQINERLHGIAEKEPAVQSFCQEMARW
jgi:hypothetical protein